MPCFWQYHVSRSLLLIIKTNYYDTRDYSEMGNQQKQIRTKI